MKIGTYYYPEQWPREQWARDFDNMASMGLQVVHMGEFAWFRLEPRPGEFDLDWLAECVELARGHRMEVILCTPTAAPPVWLVEQHPEILPVDEFGRRTRFGGRRHYSPLAAAVRDAAGRVVAALAGRFADHPAVIGWQVDNELSSPHGMAGSFDQSDRAHAAFRQWLRGRYETVDRLNDAWGCAFWSTQYTDFEQVRLPPGRDAMRDYDNPHQRLDASRFWSWALADFARLQAEILRPRVGGDRFITTNFMPLHADCNPDDFARTLTLFSWDSYPVTGRGGGGAPAPGDERFRLGDPSSIGLVHDHMASYTGRWGLMELQPGQLNWTGVPVLPYPGAVRLWLWTAFAHGAEFATTYTYRQPRVGVELFHAGLVGPDGVTPTAGGQQFRQAVAEMRRLDPAKLAPPADDYDPRSTVGLVLDFEQLWYFQTLPQSRRWDQGEWLRRWHAAASRLGLRVKVLPAAGPWPADLPVVMAPGLQMVDEPTVRQMEGYVAAGGHLVLTCRSGVMDRNGRLWEGPLAKPILPLIGGSVEAYDGLPDGAKGHVEIDGRRFEWDAWAELLYAAEGTRVLARYADQFYAGADAVIQRRNDAEQGGGAVTYCGVYAEQAFVDAIIERVVAKAVAAGRMRLATTPPAEKPAEKPKSRFRARSRAKAGDVPEAFAAAAAATENGADGASGSAAPAVPALPDRVRLLRRGPYSILLNYQDKPVNAPASASAKFLVGSRAVEPAGVAVWEEAVAAAE